MSRFHSTVSRRDFMKGLGLASAGLGATSLLNPSFKDLDEVVSAPNAEFKRSWFVTQKDVPTVAIDWQAMQRYDKKVGFGNPQFREINANTEQFVQGLYGVSDRDEALKKWARENEKGMSLRDQALWRGTEIKRKFEPARSWTHFKEQSRAMTPEEIGMPRWNGTPEENTRMLRVAGRMYGAWTIGVTELTSETKKIIWSNDGTRDIVFEAVDQGYRTATKKVIPNKCIYAVSIDIRHGELPTKTAPGAIINSAQQIAYFNARFAGASFQEFIYALGYHSVGIDQAQGSAAFPVMGGIGELGRGANIVTPEHGAMHREFPVFYTDLPLEPTKPIDSGIHKFCHECKKCAIQCPTGSIPIETEPSWEGHGTWNAPGIKSWPLDYPTCGGPVFDYKSQWGPGYCGMCMPNCTFSKLDDALVHKTVMAVSSVTPMFNAFFHKMDNAFGYGNNWQAHQKGDTYIEDWWNTLGPEWGYIQKRG